MKKQKMILCAALTGLFAVSGGVVASQVYQASADSASTFKVQEGAALRLSEPEGLRFQVSVSETEKATFGEDAEYGVLLLPQAMLGANELKFDENGEVAVANTLVVEAKAWTEDNDDSIATYSCVLSAPLDENGENTVFPAAYYNAPIVARGYVKEANGEITYTTNTATRSIGYIAKLCEVEGLTTAEETKDKYAGIATIAEGTSVKLSVNGGNALAEGISYSPSFVIGGMAADASDKVEISYVSSNESVMVIENGQCKAVGAGEAVVSAWISCNGSDAVELATQEVTVQERFEYLRSLDGEDNTLFFFDRTDGVKQVADRNKAFELHYTTEQSYGDDVGSLKIVFPGNLNDLSVTLDMKNYAYAATDYAVFYVYNGISAECINMYFSSADAVRLNKDEWTMLVRPVSDFVSKGLSLQFKGVAKANNAYYGGVNASGGVYISKMKVYSAQEVFALAGYSGEWSIGDTTFTSIAEYNSTPKMQYTNSASNDGTHNQITSAFEYKAYMVNGELRQVLWRHNYAGFYAKMNSVVDLSAEDNYMAITIKGAVADKFSIHAMSTGGEYDTIYGTLKPTASFAGEDGFVTYIFALAKNAKALNGFRITPAGDTRFTSGTSATGTNGTFDSHEIRISNITIGNAAKMAGLGYMLG